MAESNSSEPDLFGPVMLPCTRCKEVKPLEAFRKRSGRRDPGHGRRGRWSHCIDCEKALAQQPHRKKKSNAAAMRFRMRLKKKDYAEYRRRERQQNFRRNYGIEIEDYDAMVKAQDGKCAICGGPPVGGRWERDAHTGEKRVLRFSVDHDHDTGAIRELLCGRCNLALGNFQDDIALLRKAIEYLKKHGKE